MHRQIHAYIARAIREGAAIQDGRLPATRVMATLLGVSRNTVLRAYEDLAADGLIECKSGSGTRVAQSRPPAVPALRQVIKQSGFPDRTLSCEDCDGNPLNLRF